MAEMLYKDFARRRRELNLKQHEVAAAAAINQARISEIENGKGDPVLSTLEALTQALRAKIVLVPLEKLSEVERVLGAPPVGANLGVSTTFDDIFIPDPTDNDQSGNR